MKKARTNTKKSMQETLLNLLETTSFKKITVSELCKAAGVNRGTFYLHYKEVSDLFVEMEQGLYMELMTCLMMTSPEDILLQALNKVKEYSKLVKLIIFKNLDREFVEQILSVSKQYCLTQWKKLRKDVTDLELNYTYSFLSHGIIGIIIYWCESDFKESPEEIASMVENLASYFSLTF